MSRKPIHGHMADFTFDHLKEEVTSFFNEEAATNLVVPLDKQQHEIDLLKETVENERFFFVVDLQNFRIQEAHGIQRWLGYGEQEFTLEQYWNNLMHPSHKNLLMLIARELYDALCHGKYPLHFMVQRFVSLVSLKHYNGHFIHAKKTSSVFQYDKKNRLTAYMDEFTIIGDHDGGPLLPRMNDVNAKEIMEKVVTSFQAMRVFTVRELQTVRKLAYNEHITQKQIADELHLSPNTIDTNYKRFLGKAREFFRQEFRTVYDAAIYLRKEGLL